MHTPLRLLLVSTLFLALPACGGPEVIDTLSGTVVDHDGAPSPDVQVTLGNETVVSDAAGHFTFSNVQSPFDVTLILPGTHDAYVYTGLTTDTPTVRLTDRFIGKLEGRQGANVTLDLPVSPDGTEQVSVVVDRPGELASIEIPFATPSEEPGKGTIALRWFGTESAKVRIQAFRYTTNTDGSPQHYTGYDSTELSLQSSDMVSWKATWKAPTFKEKTVSVSVDLPSDYQIFQTELMVRQNGAKRGQSFVWSTGSATSMSFVVPDYLAGPIFDLQVCAYNGYNTSCRTQPGLSAGVEVHPVSVEEGPKLALESVNLGVGSEIAWSANGDGATFVLLHPATLPSTDPSFFIAGGDETITLPDLGKLGVKLPKGADYKVAVFRNSAVETVEGLGLEGPFFQPTDEASTYAYTLEAPVTTR